MGLKLKTGPTSSPITLAEAKAQCRVEITETHEDSLIQGYIDAATSYLDAQGYLGRAIMTQTWLLYLDVFSDAITLPMGPVQSVTSIKYYDENDVLQTLDADSYSVDIVSDPQWVVRTTAANWPIVASGINNVIIEFVAGDDVAPAAIKQAILLLVAQWYANRENAGAAMQEMPHAVTALLTNYRRFTFI